MVARRRNLLGELAAQIASKGHPRPEVIESDLMEDGAPERVAGAAAKALGRIDILVNSAGGSQPAIAIDSGEAPWEESMRLNFVRLRQLTHPVLPG